MRHEIGFDEPIFKCRPLLPSIFLTSPPESRTALRGPSGRHVEKVPRGRQHFLSAESTAAHDVAELVFFHHFQLGARLRFGFIQPGWSCFFYFVRAPSTLNRRKNFRPGTTFSHLGCGQNPPGSFLVGPARRFAGVRRRWLPRFGRVSSSSSSTLVVLWALSLASPSNQTS